MSTKIEVKDNKDEMMVEQNEQIENLKKTIESLASENKNLKSSLTSTLSMLRFCLGIAYHAHPDNEKIKAMIDQLYSVKEG